MVEKVTIRDVAKAVGVSVSTVSRVFNDYGDISDETRRKVLLTAQQLDYVPNNAARQLSSKKKNFIALILNEINVTPGVAMPLEILGGVIDALEKTDYEFVFYAVNTEKQQQKSLKQFCNERDISGLIIQGLKVTDPYYKELEQIKIPTVAIDMDIENENVGNISINNREAVREVTQRLVKANYHNILFVNGSKTAAVAIEREKGFRDVIKTAPQIVYADFSENAAFSLIQQLTDLASFDAIFAASDLMAIGVIKALREADMIQQFGIVGFDDITLARYITPTLTTVHQDIQRLTEMAVKDLVLQIETGQVIQRFVPYEVIVRESAKL